MKKMFIMLAALLAIAVPTASQAILWEGFYVGGYGAANFLQFDRNHNNLHHHNNRVGYALAGAIGYRWCNNFRLEAEVSYRHNKLHRHRFFGSSSSDLLGSSSSGFGRRHNSYREWSYLANAYYDLPTCWWVNPYVGAGIGYASQRLHRNNGLLTSDSSLVSLDSSSSDFGGHRNRRRGFAWQVIGGVAYPIDECLEVSVEYRFHMGRLNRLYNHDIGAALRYFF